MAKREKRTSTKKTPSSRQRKPSKSRPSKPPKKNGSTRPGARTPRTPRGSTPWELLGRGDGAVTVEGVEVADESTDRDVTDTDNERLGAFVKQTALNGYTCVIYSQGSRVMLRVK